MPRRPKPPPDDTAQSKRFTDMAREIGADATAEDFERAFKKVVPSAPGARPRLSARTRQRSPKSSE